MKPTFLAYARQSRPTGRALAKMLVVTSSGVQPPNFHPEVLIRWGTQKPMPRATLELNKPEGLVNASNKFRALQILEQAGIAVIRHVRTWEEAKREWPESFIYGRDNRGFAGRDIKIYSPSGRISKDGINFPKAPEGVKHDWYSCYQPSSREVRIHVCNGKVIRVQGKYCDHPVQMSKFIQNYNNGFRFRAPKLLLRSNKRNAAIAAVEALGLDFGAVDMLLTDDYNRTGYAILEVNTAPAGSPLTIRCYAAEIALQISQATDGAIHLAPGILANEMPYEEGDV